jgi:hypothetical protein
VPIEQWAYFWIENDRRDFDPDAVTAVLGVEPTSSYREGSPGVLGRPHRGASWTLESRGWGDEDWDDIVEPILAALRGRSDAVERAKRELGLYAGLTLVIELTADDDVEPDDDEPPEQRTWSIPRPTGSSLNAKHLAELADLGRDSAHESHVFLPDNFPIPT